MSFDANLPAKARCRPTPVLAPYVVAQDRLDALEATALLDSPPEAAFDRLTNIATAMLDAPMALISLVDAQRQFFKSAVGLAAPLDAVRETPLSHSFCQHVVASQAPFVVEDAHRDPRVRDNGAVEDFNVIAYAGVPLRAPDGHVLGSFCVIEHVPRRWSDQDVTLLTDLAETAATEIALRAKIAECERVDAALGESESRYKRLVETLPHIVYQAQVEPPYAPLYVSPSIASLGYTRDEWMASQDLWLTILHPDDRARVLHDTAAALGRGTTTDYEYRVIAKDGSVRWMHDRGTIIRDASGRALFWQRVMLDVTERREAEAALRASEARFDRVTANLPGMVFRFTLSPDGVGALTYASEGAREILGVAPEVACADPAFLDIVHPDDVAAYRDEITLSAATLAPFSWEGRICPPGASEKWVKVASRPSRWPDGTIVWDGVLLDVTERKRAEERAHAREARYRVLLENTHDIVAIVAADHTILYENPAVERVLGYQPDEVVGEAALDRVHPDDRDTLQGVLETLLAEPGSTMPVTYRARHVDGSWRVLEGSARNLTTHPSVAGIVLSVRDVTARTRAEHALRTSEARYRGLLANFPDGAVYLVDPDLQVLVADGQAFRDAGFRCADVVGRHLPDVLGAADWAAVEPFYRRALAGRSHAADLVMNERTFETCGVPVRDAGGRVMAALVISRDVTATRAADNRLRLLEAAVAHLNDLVMISEAAPDEVSGPRIVFVNDALVRRSGYALHEMLGRDPAMFLGPESDVEMVGRLRAALRGGAPTRTELLHYTKSGEPYWVEVDLAPIHDGNGRVTHFVSVERDISERKLLDRHLRQSQKLEAIGQLAAGIAHEINTPLQYVGDNISFVQDAFGSLVPLLTQLGTLVGQEHGTAVLPADTARALASSEIPYLLEEIPSATAQALDGVDRVANIVRGMKLCAHPGGVIVGVNLNQQLDKMIAVTRNEWKYVANLVTHYDADLPTVTCDVGEINQVFLNILVNAAHAISDTRGSTAAELGLITVRTGVVGDHVEVRISDTGGGIPDAIRDRIFDPFFTTKTVGRGTGQGLSIAHRVMVRHGGTITVETVVGMGSTFIVRLPLTPAASLQVA